MRAFAVTNVTEKLDFALIRVENVVENGEDAGKQHLLLFQQYFQKAYFLTSLKVNIVWYGINVLQNL